MVGNTIAAAGAIAATGVERIFIYNLPAPEFLPLPLPPEFGAVVDGHNALLAQGAAFLASQGVDAEIVDMHRIGAEIVADPRTFGLNPAYLDQPMLLGIGSQPIWVPEAQDWSIEANPVVAGVDPNRIAFTDFLHPSSAMHGVLGAFAAGSMTDNLVFLGPEDDVRRTGPGDDLVLAGAGNDRIFSGRGADTVLAGLGDDLVFAGKGRDIVAGGAGDDGVHGGRGNDVVAGSDGDDIAGGGAGRDLMVDGLGHDLHVRRPRPRRVPLHGGGAPRGVEPGRRGEVPGRSRRRRPLSRARRGDAGRGGGGAAARRVLAASGRDRGQDAARSSATSSSIPPIPPPGSAPGRGWRRPTSGGSSDGAAQSAARPATNRIARARSATAVRA